MNEQNSLWTAVTSSRDLQSFSSVHDQLGRQFAASIGVTSDD